MSEENEVILDTNALIHEIQKRTTYVKIDDEGMNAWLYLAPDEGIEYTRDDLKDILKANGVLAGFHNSNLAAIAKKKIFYREVLAAVGKPAGSGHDGYFEYYVCAEDYTKNPKINADGSVDYTSMSLLENVTEGQCLAKYYPAERGEEGFDVRGHVLPSNPVHEIPPIKGKGLSDPDAEGKYYALVDGKVAVDSNKRLEIRSVHEIPGDVDYITGMIDFNGDVVITGNVGTDVTIKAGKTVTIMGTVEAARIEAAGDVILKRGIQGNDKAVIICGGNVYADFIEQTTVEADGNVQSNTILNSTVNSKQKVILTGKRGTLLGGTTHGLFGVEAACIGNEKEIKTFVQAGATQAMMNKNTAYMKSANELRAQIKTAQEEADVFEKQKSLTGSSPLQELKSKQVMDRLMELKAKLEEVEHESAELSSLMKQCAVATVRADGNIFRGVALQINGDAVFLDKNTCYMSYACINGMIEGSVIAKN